MKEETKNKLTCPYCNRLVLASNTRLPAIQQFYRSDYDIVEQARLGKFKDWSCLSCEEKGFTLFPDHSKQNYGMGGPIPIYASKKILCVACKEEFEFSAQEQKFWYETLAFNYSSFPIRCQKCRKEDRKERVRNKKLSELMAEEPKSAEILKEIAELYLAMGKDEKAKEYFTKERKARMKEK